METTKGQQMNSNANILELRVSDLENTLAKIKNLLEEITEKGSNVQYGAPVADENGPAYSIGTIQALAKFAHYEIELALSK